MRRRWLFFLGLIGGLARAQAPELCLNTICTNDSVLCVGATLEVSAAGGGAASYDFGAQAGVDSVTSGVNTFGYDQPGIYFVTQLTEAGGAINQRQVFVLPQPVPNVRIAACGQNNAVRVAITDTVRASFTIFNRFPQNRLPSTQFPVSVRDSLVRFYDFYEVTFGDGQTLTLPGNGTTGTDTAFVYAYATPGVQNIRVRGRYAGAAAVCGGATPTIRINTETPLLAPEVVRLENLDNAPNGLARLTLRYREDLFYQLEQRTDGPFVSLASLSPIGSMPDETEEERVLTLRTTDDRCFRLRADEICGDNPASVVLCLTRLQAVNDPQLGTVALTWPPYPPQSFARYELRRDGQLLFGSGQRSDTVFVDTTAQCGQAYRYQLSVRLAAAARNGDTLQSLSNAPVVNVVSEATPPPVVQLGSSIEDERIVLRWQLPPRADAQRLLLQRSGRFPEVLSPAPTATTFTDAGLAFLPSACYTLAYEDACDNLALPSSETCPIYLNPPQTDARTSRLTWTPYVGAPGPPDKYVVEVLDAGLNLVRTLEAGLALDLADEAAEAQLTYYRVRGEFADGSPPTFSNVVLAEQRAQMLFPNVFTPNGDGINDTFRGYGRYVGAYALTIFSRWGEVVFHTEDFRNPGWDGLYRGERAPAGVYVYQAQITDETGFRFEQRGTLHLEW